MFGLKIFSLLGLALSTAAQGTFGAPENSAQILSLLQQADTTTVASGRGAAAYNPNSQQSYDSLAQLNTQLLQSWQNIITTANNSPGFYTPQGAQAIISFLNRRLGSSTEDANLIYTNRRDVFIQGGFIEFISPGLVELRTAVDAAAAAIKNKTPARFLTPMDLGLLFITQNYANTQELQMFGSAANVYSGSERTRLVRRPRPMIRGPWGKFLDLLP